MKKIIQGIFGSMKFSDSIFLCVLIANLILVAYLGVGSHERALKVGQTQANGEQIIAWFEEFGQKLEANELATPESCIPSDEGAVSAKSAKLNIWKSCVETLFAEKGPFHSYTNLLMPKDPAYALKCDKQDLGTSGAFIFEKMTMNPAGPPSVGPMDPQEKLVSGMNFRLSLCDTGYYLIKIGEFKL